MLEFAHESYFVIALCGLFSKEVGGPAYLLDKHHKVEDIHSSYTHWNKTKKDMHS